MIGPVFTPNMTRSFWLCALLFCVSPACQPQQLTADENACNDEARRVLGASARVLKVGDFLHLGTIQCIAVLPYTSHTAHELPVRDGFVVQKEGTAWRDLLRFKDNIRNQRGYVGIDFIDPEPSFGFDVELADKRSDGTPGFTIYLTYLNPKLRSEGVPVQVSWNPKVSRFQEYAPNELDPPDFKPEIANPPVRKR